MDINQKVFCEIPPCADKAIFVKKFGKNLHLYERFEKQFLSTKSKNFTHIPFWAAKRWLRFSYAMC